MNYFRVRVPLVDESIPYFNEFIKGDVNDSIHYRVNYLMDLQEQYDNKR